MSSSNQKPAFPSTSPKFPLLAPKQVINVQKIKNEATAEAVRILEEKIKFSDEELKKLRLDAYNEAVGDAEKYFMIFGCRALYNMFGFGYKRLERFLDEYMKMVENEDINEMEKWLSDVGLRLVMSDIGDEIKKKKKL